MSSLQVSRDRVVSPPERFIHVTDDRLLEYFQGVLRGKGQEEQLSALYQLLEGIIGHEFTGLRRRMERDFSYFSAAATGDADRLTGKGLPESSYDSEARFLADFCRLMAAAHYRLLGREVWDAAQSEEFLFTLPVTVNWSSLDDFLLRRHWAEWGRERAALPDLADRILIFHRGVGVARMSGLYLWTKVELLLSFYLLQPLWGALCWVLRLVGLQAMLPGLLPGLPPAAAAGAHAPQPNSPRPARFQTVGNVASAAMRLKKAAAAASARQGAVLEEASILHEAAIIVERRTLNRAFPNGRAVLRKLLKRVELQEACFSDTVVLYRRKVAHGGDDNREGGGGRSPPHEVDPGVAARNIHVKHFKRIPLADLEMVLPEKVIYVPGSVFVQLAVAVAVALGGLVMTLFSSEGFSLGMAGSATLLLVTRASQVYFQAQSERAEIEREMNKLLFERTAASQEAVLHTLTDEMSRQRIRELFVCYCVLLQAGGRPLADEELDRRCERLLRKSFGLRIDFTAEEAIPALLAWGLVQREAPAEGQAAEGQAAEGQQEASREAAEGQAVAQQQQHGSQQVGWREAAAGEADGSGGDGSGGAAGGNGQEGAGAGWAALKRRGGQQDQPVTSPPTPSSPPSPSRAPGLASTRSRASSRLRQQSGKQGAAQQQQEQGGLVAVPLAQALERLDGVWDGIFDFRATAAASPAAPAAADAAAASAASRPASAEEREATPMSGQPSSPDRHPARTMPPAAAEPDSGSGAHAKDSSPNRGSGSMDCRGSGSVKSSSVLSGTNSPAAAAPYDSLLPPPPVLPRPLGQRAWHESCWGYSEQPMASDADEALVSEESREGFAYENSKAAVAELPAGVAATAARVEAAAGASRVGAAECRASVAAACRAGSAGGKTAGQERGAKLDLEEGGCHQQAAASVLSVHAAAAAAQFDSRLPPDQLEALGAEQGAVAAGGEGEEAQQAGAEGEPGPEPELQVGQAAAGLSALVAAGQQEGGSWSSEGEDDACSQVAAAAMGLLAAQDAAVEAAGGEMAAVEAAAVEARDESAWGPASCAVLPDELLAVQGQRQPASAQLPDSLDSPGLELGPSRSPRAAPHLGSSPRDPFTSQRRHAGGSTGSSMQGPCASRPASPGAAALDGGADRARNEGEGESALVIPDSPLVAPSRRSGPSPPSPSQRSPRAQQLPLAASELPRAAEIVAGMAAAAAAATLAQHHLQLVLDSPARTSPSHSSSPPCSPHGQGGSRHSSERGSQPCERQRRCSSGEFVLLRTPMQLSEGEEEEEVEGGTPGRQQYRHQYHHQQFGSPGAGEGSTSPPRRPPSPLGRPQPAAAGTASPAPALQAKPRTLAPAALAPTAAATASSGRLSPASLKLLRLKAELADRRQQQQLKERNTCVSSESSSEEEGEAEEEGVGQVMAGLGLGPRRRTASGRSSAAGRAIGGSPVDSPRISSRVYGAAVQPGGEGK